MPAASSRTYPSLFRRKDTNVEFKKREPVVKMQEISKTSLISEIICSIWKNRECGNSHGNVTMSEQD